MLLRSLLPLILVLIFTSALFAQNAPAPLDPAVRSGVLANGIRYFLLKNAKPENRIEMRLSVQVGSLQETEVQQGLAHLVEHLQFEGTERYGPQEIISFLESNGMKFGNDLNAQTGFSDTQYFLDLPADQPPTLIKGLQILEDWAHGPKVTLEMLEKEKKIVAEEQRVRMENVQGRLSEFVLPILLAPTPYAQRQPIGKMDVLKDVTLADVAAFVERWYGPRAMSLQIVGDFDPAVLEALLKKTFVRPFDSGSQPLPEASPEVPPYTEASASEFSDPDLGANVLVWNKIIPVDPLNLPALQRLELFNFLVSFTLSKRFTELTQTADPPFLQASVSASALFDRSWLSQFQLVLKDSMADTSVEVFLTELRRLAQHGLDPSDFELALKEYRSQAEAFWAQRSNTLNTQRSSALAAYALTGRPAPSDEVLFQSKKDAADQLDLASVNQELSRWLDLGSSRLLLLSMERDGTEKMTAERVRAAVARVEVAELVALAPRVIKPLIRIPPTAGKITKTEAVAGTPLTRWTLSNGLVVYLYSNPFTKNEVQVRATAPGGLSRFGEADYLSAAFSPYLFSNTGAGDLNLNELTDFLTGHQVGLNTSIDEDLSSLTASAVPTDLEVLFQLIHKKFSLPRRDAAAEQAFLAQVTESVRNQQDLPQQLYQNELQRVLTSGAPRNRPVTVTRLAEFHTEIAAKLFTETFVGAPGFTFTITGDFDEAALRPLVETYLASLKGGKPRPVRDLGVRPLKGPLTSVLKKGQDDKAVVTILLPVAHPYTASADATAAVLQEILDIRLREVVRQAKEGTYGVNVGVSLSPFPYPNALTSVNFTCDKARQEELLAAVLGELKAIALGRFSDDVFAKAVEIRQRAWETDTKTNAWWAFSVSQGLSRGDDPKLLLSLPAFYGSLKKSAVAALAKVLADPQLARTVILNPE